MNKTKLKYVKYTKQELDRYVRVKSSCINLVNSEMHIGFPPWGFATFQETLTNIISREKIGKFDPKMNAIVLDVRNIKVFGTNYPVHDDDPINHVNIRANFYIFRPRIGATIEGIVKHISHVHVAVIIYRVFNVSIRFNRMQRTQQSLRVNDTISFRIKKFDLQGAMPYIEGELMADVHQAKTKPQIHKIFDQDGGEVENGGDSGFSTEKMSDKKVDKVLKQTAHSSNGSESSSEDDDDSSSSSSSDLDEKPFRNILLENIKIKQEQFSDSEEEAKHKKSSIVKKRKDDSSSDSESSGDNTDESEHQLRKVKKEKITSESGSSSSDGDSDSSDSDTNNGDLLVDRFKREKDEDDSSAVSSHPIVSRPIKSEPISDVEEGRTQKKSSVNAAKNKVLGKRILSISEHLDSFLADAINQTPEKHSENGSEKNKRKSTMLDETNLTDLTAAFQSPAMSSTMLPNAKVPRPTPAKVKKEIQSEDERPKKKRNKNSTKQSLDNIESELFKTYTG